MNATPKDQTPQTEGEFGTVLASLRPAFQRWVASSGYVSLEQALKHPKPLKAGLSEASKKELEALIARYRDGELVLAHHLAKQAGQQ